MKLSAKMIVASGLVFMSQAVLANPNDSSAEKNFEQIEQQLKMVQDDFQKQVATLKSQLQSQIGRISDQVRQLNQVTEKRIQTIQSEMQAQLKAANDEQQKLINQLQAQLDAIQKKS